MEFDGPYVARMLEASEDTKDLANKVCKINRLVVTCRDGRKREFTADYDTEVPKYLGSKYVYTLDPEPDGRGFIVMQNVGTLVYVLAPSWIQPKCIEADTWAGKWKWENCE